MSAVLSSWYQPQVEICTLDFETRSEADLTEVGSWEYARHPSTEVLCLSYLFDQSNEMNLWHREHPWISASPPPRALFSWIAAGKMFEAHNAGFEIAIWHFICHLRLGWPPVPLRQWTCTAAKAAASSLPRALEGACLAMDTKVKKDSNGRKLMLKLSKPRRATKADPDSKWHEGEEDHRGNWRYCQQDSAAERALSQTLKPLTDFERGVWLLDQKINQRGMLIDVEYARAALAMADHAKEQMNDELAQITGIEGLKATQRAQIKEWLREHGGMFLVDTTAERLEDTLENPPENATEDGLRVVHLMREANRTSIAKYSKTLSMVGPDNRARGLFLYCGADRTGRWSGKGLQPHNLPRAQAAKDPELVTWLVMRRDPDLVRMLLGLEVMEFLSRAIRGLVIAPAGGELVVGDYAQVEARILSWFAGDTVMLELFASGGKVYETQASDIYDVPVEEISKDDPRRQVGKQAILGLGFQMGAEKFVFTAAKAGIILTLDFGKLVVKKYRESRKPVVAMWSEVENAAIAAVINPGRTFECCDGKISYTKRGDFLECDLPSGRSLRYFRPTIRMKPTPWGEERPALFYHSTNDRGQFALTDTYGGKLVENFVQAYARELLAYAMLQAEREGLPVVMHAHDELVGEADRAGRFTAKWLEELMADTPSHARGCPITAEAWVGPRYRK